MTAPSIADYAPLSGRHSAALASRRGSIDWLSFPRSDYRGLVHRYQAGDDLAGGEGMFLVCTFWLAHALRAGRSPQASARRVRTRHLPPPRYPPARPGGRTWQRRAPRNFRQAFSHIGLINAAWAISEAETMNAPETMNRPGSGSVSSACTGYL
jgi:hypothetical protein